MDNTEIEKASNKEAETIYGGLKDLKVIGSYSPDELLVQVMGAFKRGFGAGAEWQSKQSNQLDGMMWVKAIDRLPNRCKEVFWKRWNGKKLYTGYDTFDNVKYMELPEIEWLDEPPKK